MTIAFSNDSKKNNPKSKALENKSRMTRMQLRDFVIVSQMDVSFDMGFTALTGETGAGKSILIDAVQLALGARSDVHCVREGATRTEISLEFELYGALAQTVANFLEQSGFDILYEQVQLATVSNENTSENTTQQQHPQQLLLRRIIDTQGKSRAWINGSSATLAQLKTVGEQLVDIHGQHAWAMLSRPDAGRTLLDAYAHINTHNMQTAWNHYQSSKKQLSKAQNAQEELQSQSERLQWQINELQKLAPKANEWQTLNTEHQRLANAHALLDVAQTALMQLEGSDDAPGVCKALEKSSRMLQAKAAIEPSFASLYKELENCLIQTQEAVHSLHAYIRKTDTDPAQLVELDARMAQWHSLARRYKRSPEDLPHALEQWQKELENITNSQDIKSLEILVSQNQQQWLLEATRVSDARKQAATQLSHAISAAMQELGMVGGTFAVELIEQQVQSIIGLEDVVFLVAAHAGTSPKPIAKVASGGELSRIALAIAVVTSSLGGTCTLLFDEVDAGIGGSTAHTVGRLMRQLGQSHQVLAVTHLAQVASYAHQHWKVDKTTQTNESGQVLTYSSLSAVHGASRVEEVARLLGGHQASHTSLAHAKEMLEQALK